jgi:serine/threonine-protein kinase RsbW
MTATPTGRSMRIPSEAGHLAEVRAFVRDATTSFGGSAAMADDLVQAADEAVCNVILHGYRGGSGEIELEAELSGDRIELRILDRGPAFDPTIAPVPDLSVPPRQRKPGGMGIHLVRTGTDEVHHRIRAGGGNELRLVRRIAPSTEEG